MHSLQNLEIHLVHSCNLACEGCSHYSNQGHKGVLQLEQAEEWMRAWSTRLRPAIFSLLGGEPSLHPRLPQFVDLARDCWPEAALRLVTNGFFLHRHPDLPRALREAGNARLCVSIHHDGPQYRQRMAPVLELLTGWVERFAIRVEYYHSWHDWTRRYHGAGAAMQPFADGRPRASWEHCSARYCPQIHEGKLWKCGALAYLPMQDAKYGLSETWRPYLGYVPLSPDCSQAELREFLAREEESHCGMCPAAPQRLMLPLPLTAHSG